MTPEDLIPLAIEPALSILPPVMDTPAARAMLIAVCLQESSLKRRRQYGNGPARGWPQFEPIGIVGVQEHHTTKSFAAGVHQILGYRDSEIYTAIEHNDVLACAYARLLLWRYPRALPDGRMEADEGWKQYLHLWAPSKARPEDWEPNYLTAWRVIARG